MIYIISKRGLFSSIVMDGVYEVEDILASCCEAEILVPKSRKITKLIHTAKLPKQEVINRIIGKTVGNFQKVNYTLFNDSKILLLFCLNGADLSILESIPEWRKKFDIVAAFICDAWIIKNNYPKYTSQLDHLFVPMPEIMDDLEKKLGVSVSLIPFAADVLGHGGAGGNRPYDLVSFGRTPSNYNDAFLEKFNYPISSRIYYRFRPRAEVMYPEKSYEERLDKQDLNKFFEQLKKGNLCLCFDGQHTTEVRKFPHPFVTQRWFYAAATGCGIIGKAPKNNLLKELFDWEDATIELPDDPQEAVELTEALLKDSSRLEAISKRNYYESLKSHDWRHRLRDMFNIMGVSLPPGLVAQLQLLKTLESQVF